MDLTFTQEQEMLKRTARQFLTVECPRSKVRELEEDPKGYCPELWRSMAKLGWHGMIIPEQYGGAGMDFQDIMVLVEEMGRNILPGPFLCTLTAVFAILEAADEEQKENLLPQLAQGNITMTLAVLEPSSTHDADYLTTTALQNKDGFVITGTKLFVEMAHISDYIICAANVGKEGLARAFSLFIVNSSSLNIYSKVIPTIGMDKLCEVHFENTQVYQQELLGKLNRGWSILSKALRKGTLAKCAESIGGMQASLDMTLSYMKTRVQYDRPIGAFQAPQHILADMWITLETSRRLIYNAIWLESNGLPCVKEASMAKAYVNEAYKWLTKWAIRLHGAIGTSRDHDIGIYYRRAKAADIALGTTDFHREIVAREIGLVSQ